MPFEGLDATFRGIRSFLVWWDGVVYDVLRREEIEEVARYPAQRWVVERETSGSTWM
jgi:hypothetical protein